MIDCRNIAKGKDSGVIAHGHNLEELIHLTDVGMSNDEAIASGTIKAAEFICKEDSLGSVSENKIADLIWVNGKRVDDVGFLADNDHILKVREDGCLVKDI